MTDSGVVRKAPLQVEGGLISWSLVRPIVASRAPQPAASFEGFHEDPDLVVAATSRGPKGLPTDPRVDS